MGVGMPQSRKSAPIPALWASLRASARALSIAAMLLPPAPPTSIADDAGRFSARACSKLMPAPVSLAIRGTPTAGRRAGRRRGAFRAAVALWLRGLLQEVEMQGQGVRANHLDGAADIREVKAGWRRCAMSWGAPMLAMRKAWGARSRTTL